jgi:multicomponent K+:H+ antiporter subunit A
MKIKSLIVTAATKYIVILLNIVAIAIFLKGHNEPGGGFIAGTISAVSLIMLVIVYGVNYTKALIKFNPIILAISGLLIAYGICITPLFFDLPFMFHTEWSPMVFDFGVYLVVVGVISKIIMMIEETK